MLFVSYYLYSYDSEAITNKVFFDVVSQNFRFRLRTLEYFKFLFYGIELRKSQMNLLRGMGLIMVFF